MVNYRILDNNKRVDETYLRKLLFEYELVDIGENMDYYFDGTYDLKAQFHMLDIAQNGEFDVVLYHLSTNWQVDVEELFKVGDKVKIPYISDCHKYNNKVGTIKWLHDFKFYPNAFPSVEEIKTQAIVEYDDGGELEISDLYREPSGLVSKVIKVVEDEE